MRRILVLLAALGLVLCAAGPVSARATVFTEGPWEWQQETCGIATDVHVTGRVVFVNWVTVDDIWGGPTIVNIHDTFVYTNPANLRTATYDWFGKLTQTFVGQDPETGTITLLQTYYGLESRVKADGGSTVAIDAGRLTLSTTWTVDGTQLGADLVGLKGPHPMVTSDTAFCDAILGALT